MSTSSRAAETAPTAHDRDGVTVHIPVHHEDGVTIPTQRFTGRDYERHAKKHDGDLEAVLRSARLAGIAVSLPTTAKASR